MPSLLDIILGRKVDERKTPECPIHHLEMDLRGKIGRPSRFAGTSEEDYTLVYYCPVPDCNETGERTVRRTQIPVPHRSPRRPAFSRANGSDQTTR